MKLWSNNTVPKSSGAINPERRLLAAVLQRAITDYLGGEGEVQESAREWLFGVDDPSETFGFAYVCEALDFHQEELQKAISAQYENQLVQQQAQANIEMTMEPQLAARAA